MRSLCAVLLLIDFHLVARNFVFDGFAQSSLRKGCAMSEPTTVLPSRDSRNA